MGLVILNICYRSQNNALSNEITVLRSDKEELTKKIAELRFEAVEDQEPSET